MNCLPAGRKIPCRHATYYPIKLRFYIGTNKKKWWFFSLKGEINHKGCWIYLGEAKDFFNQKKFK